MDQITQRHVNGEGQGQKPGQQERVAEEVTLKEVEEE